MNNTKENIFANVNMDMIGRLKDHLLVQGIGSAQEWKALVESVARGTDLSIQTQEDPYLPTDSMAFYMKQVPTINFFTGAHAEYHSPRDTADLINYEGHVRIVNFIQNAVEALGAQSKLTYLKVEGGKSKLEGRSFRLYLGTVPDYSQQGIKGVKITGTAKDSPAEKSGLKSGDVIVQLAGTKIENLYDYVYCLQSMKANQPTEIHILRNGKEEVLSIVPQMKE